MPDGNFLKILILKPSSLGDVIHALPVLRLIKLRYPTAQVSWWLESSLVPLLENDPDLDRIFPFIRNSWASPANWPGLISSVRALRQERFDVAIDLQGLARSAVFTWLTNSGLNLGLSNPREGGREGAHMAYDRTPPQCATGTHAVDRYLAVLPMLDVPVHQQFDWLPERLSVAASVREKWNPGATRWISLLPGARWDNKRWPVEYFRDLTVQILRQYPDVKISVLGSRSDRDLGARIASVNPHRCLDLTGRTSLLEMIEWIRLNELVITNDTGPMHVAAALRRPVLALFGPTAPGSTGPYGQIDKVLQDKSLNCIPCLKSRCGYKESLACLLALTPERVSVEVKRRLG